MAQPRRDGSEGRRFGGSLDRPQRTGAKSITGNPSSSGQGLFDAVRFLPGNRAVCTSESPPTIQFPRRWTVAELLVIQAGEEERHAGNSCWDAQEFYSSVVLGLLAAAIAIAGLSPTTLPVWERASIVVAVGILATAFATAGRRSLAVQSFNLVRARAVRKFVTEILIREDQKADLQPFADALVVPLWEVQPFLARLKDSDLRTELRKEFVKGTIPEHGIRRSMYDTLGALQGLGGGVAAVAVGLAIDSLAGVVPGIVCGLVVAALVAWLVRSTLNDARKQLGA